jgi:hypothetical protein
MCLSILSEYLMHQALYMTTRYKNDQKSKKREIQSTKTQPDEKISYEEIKNSDNLS